MNKHAELDALGFGNRPLKPRDLSIAKFFLRNRTNRIHQIHEALVDRNRVTTKTILSRVGDRESRNARERFHR